MPAGKLGRIRRLMLVGVCAPLTPDRTPYLLHVLYLAVKLPFVVCDLLWGAGERLRRVGEAVVRVIVARVHRVGEWLAKVAKVSTKGVAVEEENVVWVYGSNGFLYSLVEG